MGHEMSEFRNINQDRWMNYNFVHNIYSLLYNNTLHSQSFEVWKNNISTVYNMAVKYEIKNYSEIRWYSHFVASLICFFFIA